MSDKILYQEEEYSVVIEEIKELIGDHYKEIALYQDKIELAPDFNFYKTSAEKRMIRFYTARLNQEVNTLIGYFVVFVAESPHYSDHLFANNDILFLEKEYRSASTGRGLISFSEERLKKEGVSVLNINTKTHQPFDTLMLSMGFDCVERVYGKYIGE